jgi:hypothetical protein
MRSRRRGTAAHDRRIAHECDPDGDIIEGLVDIDPQEQNRFVPLTGHQIFAPEETARRNVGAICMTNSACTR